MDEVEKSTVSFEELRRAILEKDEVALMMMRDVADFTLSEMQNERSHQTDFGLAQDVEAVSACLPAQNTCTIHREAVAKESNLFQILDVRSTVRILHKDYTLADIVDVLLVFSGFYAPAGPETGGVQTEARLLASLKFVFQLLRVREGDVPAVQCLKEQLQVESVRHYAYNFAKEKSSVPALVQQLREMTIQATTYDLQSN